MHHPEDVAVNTRATHMNTSRPGYVHISNPPPSIVLRRMDMPEEALGLVGMQDADERVTGSMLRRHACLLGRWEPL